MTNALTQQKFILAQDHFVADLAVRTVSISFLIDIGI
jgi:hypothetical protein